MTAEVWLGGKGAFSDQLSGGSQVAELDSTSRLSGRLFGLSGAAAVASVVGITGKVGECSWQCDT